MDALSLSNSPRARKQNQEASSLPFRSHRPGHCDARGQLGRRGTGHLLSLSWGLKTRLRLVPRLGSFFCGKPGSGLCTVSPALLCGWKGVRGPSEQRPALRETGNAEPGVRCGWLGGGSNDPKEPFCSGMLRGVPPAAGERERQRGRGERRLPGTWLLEAAPGRRGGFSLLSPVIYSPVSSKAPQAVGSRSWGAAPGRRCPVRVYPAPPGQGGGCGAGEDAMSGRRMRGREEPRLCVSALSAPHGRGAPGTDGSAVVGPASPRPAPHSSAAPLPRHATFSPVCPYPLLVFPPPPALQVAAPRGWRCKCLWLPGPGFTPAPLTGTAGQVQTSSTEPGAQLRLPPGAHPRRAPKPPLQAQLLLELGLHPALPCPLSPSRAFLQRDPLPAACARRRRPAASAGGKGGVGPWVWAPR